MKRLPGKVQAINGNMIIAQFEGDIMQNEVGYVVTQGKRLKAEVIKISDTSAYMQVFENTEGIKIGDSVEFTANLLSVQVGPGLLSQIYDGLQNPLVELAADHGFFLPAGVEKNQLSVQRRWDFSPSVSQGDFVSAGMTLGTVPEGIFKHKIMVPFNLNGQWQVEWVSGNASYSITDKIAVLKNNEGRYQDITMCFYWPVKIPITAYAEKLMPKEPLVTNIRIVDTFFPVAKGGTYCIPGPFGAGKTVLQQLTSRYADVDIVIIAACGERAGEVVETLREFPELSDPRTGGSLMDRTIIICNTSSMPVAARESSVYTATTIAEYYRQMGLNVLLLADSTSRWAQAMREISGRLEEIPGEEAYPAYLESRIASFYERAGLVKLYDGALGSLTIGGTVSPAGGNFEEPVTQSTLKVVGAFHGLSRDRANARKFPSIDPLESWSKYSSVIPSEQINIAREILIKGNDVNQMMKVIGEEGTSMDDFVLYLKSDFLDSVYLQQNAFDEVDASTPADRQRYTFTVLLTILQSNPTFKTKQEARDFFYSIRKAFIDWNGKAVNTEEFNQQEQLIQDLIGGGHY